MDLTFDDRELAFRDELRGWFAGHDPGPAPTGDEDAHYQWRRDFQRRLARDGWAAVHWPVEYGGRGATLTESAIFFEELGRSGAPLPANVLGLLLAGPTIMTWGTPEQKDRYLGPILTAEEIWCQGFSEPDAGSDLAAVKTRAVRDGGAWVVTGQKVWTSGAQYSKWCMLVARTDPDAARHQGLTYFLMDMEHPGVEVRPRTCSAETATVDFDPSEDQQEIKAVARELLTARSGWSRVRQAALAGEYDVALWRELCELGWTGIAVTAAVIDRCGSEPSASAGYRVCSTGRCARRSADLSCSSTAKARRWRSSAVPGNCGWSSIPPSSR